VLMHGNVMDYKSCGCPGGSDIVVVSISQQFVESFNPRFLDKAVRMLSTVPALVAFAASLVTVVKTVPVPYVIASNGLKGRVQVQAHRGGVGVRSEESLWAFANAMVRLKLEPERSIAD
jgi:hypothetical protein